MRESGEVAHFTTKSFNECKCDFIFILIKNEKKNKYVERVRRINFVYNSR